MWSQWPVWTHVSLPGCGSPAVATASLPAQARLCRPRRALIWWRRTAGCGRDPRTDVRQAPAPAAESTRSRGGVPRYLSRMHGQLVADAKALASSCLASGEKARWAHVQAAGELAERLAPAVPEHVVAAAWLHDIGYASEALATGFHPLDGAGYLAARGVGRSIVSLVAYHSGARFEATERRMSDALEEFGSPDPDDLDALTLIDMTTGPDGSQLPASVRISEILERYGPDSVVHRAVTAARAELMASVARAARRLGLPDEGFGSPL